MIITGKDFRLTPSVKVYVEEKFSYLSKHSRQPILDLKVMLDIDRNQKHGDICRVEASALWRKKSFKAGVKASEMHEAIDLCVEKLERQIRDAKERWLSQRAGHHGL